MDGPGRVSAGIVRARQDFAPLVTNSGSSMAMLQEPEFVQTGPSMRFGIGTPDPKDPKKFLTKLTYDEFGRTNNVCVRVDRTAEFLWGVDGGAWKPNVGPKQELGKDPQGNRQIGARADWVRAGAPITVTQWVKLVPGGLSRDGKKRLLDTCLIRYDITNVVNQLRAEGRWRDDQVSVTFVPRGLIPPPGLEAAAAQAPVPEARIGKVTIVSE